MVELSHRPAKLNAILLGGGIGEIWGKQSCAQQQPDDPGKPVHDPWRHRAIPNLSLRCPAQIRHGLVGMASPWQEPILQRTNSRVRYATGGAIFAKVYDGACYG
jgi:hypothetical protein